MKILGYLRQLLVIVLLVSMMAAAYLAGRASERTGWVRARHQGYGCFAQLAANAQAQQQQVACLVHALGSEG